MRWPSRICGTQPAVTGRVRSLVTAGDWALAVARCRSISRDRRVAAGRQLADRLRLAAAAQVLQVSGSGAGNQPVDRRLGIWPLHVLDRSPGHGAGPSGPERPISLGRPVEPDPLQPQARAPRAAARCPKRKVEIDDGGQDRSGRAHQFGHVAEPLQVSPLLSRVGRIQCCSKTSITLQTISRALSTPDRSFARFSMRTVVSNPPPFAPSRRTPFSC